MTSQDDEPAEVEQQQTHSGSRQFGRRRKSAQPQAPSRPLEIPPDVKPPTMGRPEVQFRRNVRKQIEDPARPGYVLVPKPNDQELAIRRERDYVAEIEQAKKDLLNLTNQRSRAIVVFVNSKGNGATTTSTIWTGHGLCIEAGKEVTLLDGNFASGTVARRVRLQGLTVTERELADNLKAVTENHGTFNEYVRSNIYRVRVIGAKSTMEGRRKLTAAEYQAVALAGFNNCDYLYVDSPNEISGDQCLALLELAHLIVFTANVGEQDSLNQLGTSMQTLRNHGLADKVNKSVVLINNLPPGAKPSDYLKFQHEVDDYGDVIHEFPGHRGPWVGIRHDRAMSDARPVSWEELQRETAQDIRLFNITVLKQLEEKPPLRKLKRSEHPSFSPQGTSTTSQEGEDQS